MTDAASAPTLLGDTADRLTGKTAIVTGASSGIGAATARLLARQGAHVLVAARRQDRLDALVADIRASGGAAIPQVTDVTDEQDVTAMVQRAVDEFGHLDYAVNNAGMPGRGAFLEIPLARFDQVVATNLRSVVLSMRAELPVMLAAGEGAIVNTASVGGLVGVPNLSAYSASKHAVVGLTRSAALEFATTGVRINAIAPGGTDTEMLSSGSQAQRDTLASLSAMKRISAPAEIARAIVFLLADATFTTGIVLAADGGQTA